MLLLFSQGLFGQTKDSTNYNNEPIENINTLPHKDTIRTVAKNDSIKAKKGVKKAIYGKARTAAILSVAIPGAGQAYNRQYWKMPLVYAALGGLGYWAYNNNKNYKKYSNGLRAAYKTGNPDSTAYVNTRYSTGQLITEKNQYKKSRDLALILCGLAYLLNIIDANVSAHLKTFDVSNDLSLQFRPYYNLGYNNHLQTGLSIKLNFK
jgi:hypothetical protein